jgi:hypothetical protein
MVDCRSMASSDCELRMLQSCRTFPAEIPWGRASSSVSARRKSSSVRTGSRVERCPCAVSQERTCILTRLLACRRSQSRRRSLRCWADTCARWIYLCRNNLIRVRRISMLLLSRSYLLQLPHLPCCALHLPLGTESSLSVQDFSLDDFSLNDLLDLIKGGLQAGSRPRTGRLNTGAREPLGICVAPGRKSLA